MSSRKWTIIVEAPHVCVWPEEADPPCDMRTDDFSRRLSLALESRSTRDSDVMFDVVHLESNVPRIECDLNRKQCRHLPYRRKLRALVQQRSPHVIVLDVHSFQNDTNWFASTTDRRKSEQETVKSERLPLQKRPDVVLLDAAADGNRPEHTASLLTRKIASSLRDSATVWRTNEHVLPKTDSSTHADRLAMLGLLVSSNLPVHAALVQDGEQRLIDVRRSRPLVYVFAGSTINDIMVEMQRTMRVPCTLIEFRQGLTGPSLDSIINAIADAVVSQMVAWSRDENIARQIT